MFAKRFFYVCAGLLCLMVAYHVGARYARAQGATTSSQEVAVLSGAVPDGGTIPLPHYRDGTEAPEGECQWIVSQQTLENDWGSEFERCSTNGRTVRIYGCPGNCAPHGDCVPPDAPGCPGAQPGVANYIIIATRVDGPVSTQGKSWGEIKAGYR